MITVAYVVLGVVLTVLALLTLGSLVGRYLRTRTLGVNDEAPRPRPSG